MVQISEWLPNPAGADAEGEWIELWNSGQESVPLQGWRLTDAAGRSFRLGAGRLESQPLGNGGHGHGALPGIRRSARSSRRVRSRTGNSPDGRAGRNRDTVLVPAYGRPPRPRRISRGE